MSRIFNALGSFGFFLWFTPALAEMDRLSFEKVNHLIIDTYAPVVAHKYHAVLELKELWHDFGGAFKVDSAQKPLGEPRFIITLTGQIPHNPHMNADGYAIVACHEIGHIVGGSPYQSRRLTMWSAVEGQADYYATNECMWHYVRRTKHERAPQLADEQSTSLCRDFYGHDQEKFEGCLRIISGINAFRDYFNSTTSSLNPVSLARFDPRIVKETLNKYPSNQCRIDTMIAGLLNIEKPQCWYKKA